MNTFIRKVGAPGSTRAGRWLGMLIVLLTGWALLCGAPAAAAAAGIDTQFPIVHHYFPKATRFGPIAGKPPAANVYEGGKIIGYVFESKMVAAIPAYSGRPINILIAIDTSGRIVGTKVLQEDEPIFLIGIPVQKLYDFVHRYIGHRVTDDIVVGNIGGSGRSVRINAISSATVTSMAANQTIMDAAIKLAVSRNVVAASAVTGVGGASHVRMKLYHPADWQQLIANGAIRRIHLTRGQVVASFKGQPPPLFPEPTSPPPPGHAKDTFINLYYSLITPPTVGRNLLGKSAYEQVLDRMHPGDQALAIMANGIYSFKGVGYVRGGLFGRIHVMQGRTMVLFHDYDYLRLTSPKLKGMPAFNEMGIFIIHKKYDFDVGRPWRLQLLVRRQVGPLQSVYSTFSGGYQTPAAYLRAPPRPVVGPGAPLWLQVWYGSRFRLAVLVAGLLVLGAVLVFQDYLVRKPTLLERIRVGYLIYTLIFLGWYGLAQLSVVNIFAFFHAVVSGFHWSTFLIDPMMFILWVVVAVSVLMLGRGVYCGWLCPFGALQALISKAAKALHIRQFELPPALHERLWALKYIILLVLFGLSLQSVTLAERYAEVEPFKTAIDLHFVRAWPFDLYAGVLLLVSVFNSKFYCKYLCPLGAGLAITGRYRLFEWLKRRRECGHPCQICAKECEVQAIDPLGRININECHYCLDCQVTYWNDAKCPPLVERRKRRERFEAAHPRAAVPVPSKATETARTQRPPGTAN